MFRSLAFVLLVACNASKDTTPTGDDDDDTTEGECSLDDDCARGREICEEGACVPGDRNNSLEEALPVLLGDENAVTGHVFPEGDLDWYAYEAIAPGWVSIRTVVEDDIDLDTVVTLYAPNGAEHAVGDDYPVWPFGVNGFDTVLYAYLTAPGTWYFTVQDITSYLEDQVPNAARNWKYEVLVREAGGTLEPDSVGDASVSVDIENGNSVTFVGVVLDEPGDRDYIELSFPFDDQLLEVWGQPALSGSSASPLVRILDGGMVAAEKVGLGEQGYLSWFRAHSGNFILEVTDAEGRGAADAWVPLYMRTYEPGDNHPFFGTNVYERELEPNDDVTTALVLTPDPEGSGNEAYNAFRLDGEVNTPGDVDWWRVEAQDGDTILVRCWTRRFGSLAELDVELYLGGTPFASGQEPDDEDYYITYTTVPGPGPVDVRIVGGPDSNLATWYRCAVYIAP